MAALSKTAILPVYPAHQLQHLLDAAVMALGELPEHARPVRGGAVLAELELALEPVDRQFKAHDVGQELLGVGPSLRDAPGPLYISLVLVREPADAGEQCAGLPGGLGQA